MELTTDERLQEAFGQLMALNNAVVALLAAHTNKPMPGAALDKAETITAQTLLQCLDQLPDRGALMHQAYLHQQRAFRAALEP